MKLTSPAVFVFITFIGYMVKAEDSDTDLFDINQKDTEDDLVDPFDIFNYDRSTKTMFPNARKVVENESHPCEEKLKLCEAQIEKLSQKDEILSKTVPVAQNVESSPPVMSNSEKKSNVHDKKSNLHEDQSILYLRRFVNILLNAAQLDREMPLDLDVDLRMSVSFEQLEILQMFGSGKRNIPIQDLDDVLSSVLFTARKSMFSMSYSIPWFTMFEYLMSKEVLLCVALGVLPVLFLRLLNGHSILQTLLIFLTIIFMLSFFITYLQLCKQEEIKQYAELKRNPDIPTSCLPDSELSWTQFFARRFTSALSQNSDECKKYYEAQMMDPFLKVTPTIVISEMIGSFVLQSSPTFGTAIARFSGGILRNLPFGTNYIVLIMSFFVVICIVFAMCGGIIKFPFYLGGVELRGGRRTIPAMTSEPQSSTLKDKKEILNNDTFKELFNALGSSEHGVVITTARGIQILSGNEIVGSVKNTPGCCGESNTQCPHMVNAPTTTAVIHPKKICIKDVPKSTERDENSEMSEPLPRSPKFTMVTKVCSDHSESRDSEKGCKISNDVEVLPLDSNERVQTLDPGEHILSNLDSGSDVLPDENRTVVGKDMSTKNSGDNLVHVEDCEDDDFLKL